MDERACWIRRFAQGVIASVLLLALHAHAQAPLPRAAAEERLALAPPALHDFFMKARAADRIHDPLKRCLAYPDYPGNHWPDGLARLQCHEVFDPHISHAFIRKAITGGRVHALDASFAADLSRHFLSKHFSEAIHHDFLAVEPDSSSDAAKEWNHLTRSWLRQDPASPYAITARAMYYRDQAWTARGGDWISKTPAKNLRRMEVFAVKAIALYEKALKIEPRMMPAYVGLVDMGMVTSRNALAQNSHRKGRAVDKGCYVLEDQEMRALEPRWGGSYADMLALSFDLYGRAAQRPLLYLVAVEPQIDLIRTLGADKKFKRAYSVAQITLPTSSTPELYERSSETLAYMRNSRPWTQLAYLLEASRFEIGDDGWSFPLARLITNLVGDDAWAIPNLRRTVDANPDFPWGHEQLAEAYFGTRHFDDAEKEYRIAANYQQTRYQAQQGLVMVAIFQHSPKKAKAYLDAFTRSYPDDAEGWFFRGQELMQLHDPDARAALEKFVSMAKTSDPNMRRELFFARRYLHEGENQSLRLPTSGH